MQYGQSAKLYFQVFVQTTGEKWTGALTPALLSAKISKDGGAFAATTNNISTSPTQGLYTLTLTAEEMTCDSFVIAFVEGGLTAPPIIGETTRPTDLSGLATAADLADVKDWAAKVLGLAGDFTISGTTLTATNPDGTTTAYTLTLDTDGNITAITEAST